MSKGLGGTSLERGWIILFAGILLVAALVTMFTIGGFGALTGFALGVVLCAAAVGLIIVVGFVALGVQRTVTDKRVRYLALGVAAVTFLFSSQITEQFHFSVYPMSMAESVEAVNSPFIWVVLLGVLLLLVLSYARKIHWR